MPLVLQLKDSGEGEEYALIRWGCGQKLSEKRIALDAISKEVDSATEAICSKEAGGANKDVVDEELELEVYRRGQDDLTLIDLPGMTRVAIEGQHSGIGETIKKMYEVGTTKFRSIFICH